MKGGADAHCHVDEPGTHEAPKATPGRATRDCWPPPPTYRLPSQTPEPVSLSWRFRADSYMAAEQQMRHARVFTSFIKSL